MGQALSGRPVARDQGEAHLSPHGGRGQGSRGCRSWGARGQGGADPGGVRGVTAERGWGRTRTPHGHIGVGQQFPCGAARPPTRRPPGPAPASALRPLSPRTRTPWCTLGLRGPPAVAPAPVTSLSRLVSQRLRHLSDQFLALKAFSGAHLIDSVLPGGLEVQARGWDRERPAWPPRRAPHGAGRAEQPLSKPLTQEEGESARWVGKGQAVPAPSPAPRTEPAGRVGAGGVSTLTVLQLGRH